MLFFKSKDDQLSNKGDLLNNRYKTLRKLGEGTEAFIHVAEDTEEKNFKYKK